MLEWVTMPSSRGSSRPRDWTHVSYVSCTGRWILYQQCHLGSPSISHTIMRTSNATLSICPTLSCLHVHESVLYVWVSTPALQIGSSAPLFCYHVFFKGEHKRLSWLVLCLSLRETKHTQLAKPDKGRGRRCTESLTPNRHHVNSAHRRGTAQENHAPSSAFTHALPEASGDLNSGLCLATN